MYNSVQYITLFLGSHHWYCSAGVGWVCGSKSICLSCEATSHQQLQSQLFSPAQWKNKRQQEQKLNIYMIKSRGGLQVYSIQGWYALMIKFSMNYWIHSASSRGGLVAKTEPVASHRRVSVPGERAHHPRSSRCRAGWLPQWPRWQTLEPGSADEQSSAWEAWPDSQPACESALQRE